MATIQDVAKTAKVSTATVSRVLNNSYSVKAKTRNTVLSAMRELNYQPNHFSQSLRRQQSNILLVLMADYSNPCHGDILSGMDEVARICGYSLQQVATFLEPNREREAIGWLESKQADGAVFLSPSLPTNEMERINERFPVVQCCEFLDSPLLAHVSINNYLAAFEAIEHLIRIGHRRVAMFSSTNNFISTSERERGYRDALAKNSIEYDERLLLRGNYSFESGINNVQRLLLMDNRPTAIAAISDTVAAGAIRGITDAGLSIPGDIAVMGFDNVELSRMVTPPLSTVSQPLRLLGKTAIKMLIDRLEGRPIVSEVYLPYEIVLRKSTL